MREFWDPFSLQIDEKTKMAREDLVEMRRLGTDAKSGRPVTVRMARYGPIVQIGTRDDEEKPLFAGLRPGQNMHTITMEEAMKLFELPRDLGKTPEGEPLSVSIGRFGPYVKYGSKFASIKDDDPYTITYERALEVVKEKIEADKNKVIKIFDDSDVQILRGRYGPYITNGSKNARIPKDTEPESLSLETCLELLEKAKAKPARGRGAKKKKK